MDFSQVGTMAALVERHGLAIVLVVCFVVFLLIMAWPYWKNRNDSASKRVNDREDTLLKRAFDSADAQVALTKEVSKNMGEGNVIMANIGQNMLAITAALENVVKRLEVSEATTNAHHAQNVKMFDFFEDFAHQAMQNRGDGRNIIQKHESAQRAVKKSQEKSDEVLA